MIKIQENVSLKDFTTFRIGGPARFFSIIKNKDDLKETISFVKSRKLPLFVLGGGSNILIADKGFSGMAIRNEIKGIKFIDQGLDQVIVEVGAGESLDDVIALSTTRKLFGLENMSGIPGTVGGAVVQNAGAYGAEIKDCLVSVEGINCINGKGFILENKDCLFNYRSSFFKKNKKFIITAINLKLSKKPVINIEYGGLKNKFLDKKEITSDDIRGVILGMRTQKLPDWHKVGTAGSFFKNPILTENKYQILKEKYPELPGFAEKNKKIKVSLAWILDNICGLKGYKDGNMGLYESQPLVFVNLGEALASDVISFSDKIKNIVKEKIGIEIEEEVEKIK
jgi:UDP-N-acetylmuramate dehydrogenase